MEEKEGSRFLKPAAKRQFFRYPLNSGEKRGQTTPFEFLPAQALCEAWRRVEKESMEFIEPDTNPHQSFYGYRPESSKHYVVAPEPSFAGMPEMHLFDYKIPVSLVTFLRCISIVDISINNHYCCRYTASLQFFPVRVQLSNL